MLEGFFVKGDLLLDLGRLVLDLGRLEFLGKVGGSWAFVGL